MEELPPTPTQFTPISLTYSGSSCALDGEEAPIAAGAVPLSVNNQTDADAEFHLWRVADGHSYEEFKDYIDEEARLAKSAADGLGPPSYAVGLVIITAPPGTSDRKLNIFTPGTYAIVCFREYLQVGGRPSALVGPLIIE